MESSHRWWGVSDTIRAATLASSAGVGLDINEAVAEFDAGKRAQLIGRREG